MIDAARPRAAAPYRAARWILAGALGILPGASGAELPAKPAVAAPQARYYAGAELQSRPQIRTHVMPEYPKDLVSGVRGRVVLDLFISSRGTVERVSVVRAEPPGRFEAAATKAFRQARFTPGMREGKAVPSRMRIEVTFGR